MLVHMNHEITYIYSGFCKGNSSDFYDALVKNNIKAKRYVFTNFTYFKIIA